METFEEVNISKPQMQYLIFAVDGTAAMGPYWKNIFSDYLDKIIRYINRKTEQNPEAMLWLGLVVYKARGLNINTDFAGKTYKWTRNVDKFLEELLSLKFGGGDDLDDAAIADGLNGALVLYPKPQIGGRESLVAQYASAERHCVLVAASNPFVLPTKLQSPVVKGGRMLDLETESRTIVVDDVAEIFAQCSVSLSVISAKQLPRLKKIFNVGNGITEEVASANCNGEYNPHEYLVLLSEKFPDIHSALKEEQTMMTRSPSPASVEGQAKGQAKFMEMEADSGNQTPDEHLKIMEQILDEDVQMQDHIYPEENFTIMPGITPRVLNGPSIGFTTTITSIQYSDSETSYDEDRMRYEAVLADNMGATLNLAQDLQTLMAPMIEDEESSAHEDGFLAKQEPDQSSTSSTLAQILGPERPMTPIEIEENMLPPLMITEVLPSRPQFFYNFMPEELAMVQTVCQTGRQVTTDSIIVSSVSSINSNLNTSQPVGLQTAYTGQVGSQSIMLSTGSLEPRAILEVSHMVTQPVPGSLTCSAAPSLAAYLSVSQSATPGLVGHIWDPQAADSSLAGNLMDHVAETLGLPEILSIPQAADSGLAGNLTVPLAETLGLLENLSAPQAANSGLAGNLSVYQVGCFDVPCSSRIDEELQPRTTLGIVGEQGGSDTQIEGGQSFQITMASVIERELGVHGGMNAIDLANLDHEQDGYVLSWQGNINAELDGEILHFGQAKAYIKLPAQASLIADWPQTISVDQVLRQEGVFELPYTGEVDIVIFAAMANQRLYAMLKKNNYCLRVDLPSKPMIIFPTESNGRFFGALFRGHIPAFIPGRSLQQPVAMQVLKQEPDTDDTVSDETIGHVMREKDGEMPEGTMNQQ